MSHRAHLALAATPWHIMQREKLWSVPVLPPVLPEQVGKITVTAQTTYVAIAREFAHEAVRKLSAGKVKGKPVKGRALED